MDKDLNIDYSVSFHVDGGVGGKRKASLAKSKYLEGASNRYHFVSLNKTLASIIGVYFTAVFTELKHVVNIIFRSKKPDVIFVRTFFGYFYNWIGKLYKIKIIREVHTEFKDDTKIIFRKSYIKKKLGILVNYFEIKSLKKADGVIFNNPDLEEYFIDTYGLKKDKTVSIYNACDPDEFYPGDRLESREKLGLPHGKNDIILLFIGSAIQWHGLEYLIEVFKKIKEKNPNYFLYIVGLTDSEYNLKLKETYSEIKNLHLIDRVPTDAARLYINAADLCMVTTAKILISQGSPTKLYDFIACGKPVVSQRGVRGYGSVVDEHQLGCSVDFMKPEEASEDIVEFVNKTDLRKLGQHNRKKAVEELNWKNAISRWIEFATSL
ncbi:MAG: glycosyltransferase family 4 protein [Balneolaceae bacterium]|nr:glycosyltransferase family 4 protein [Balneolaceae bacterium]